MCGIAGIYDANVFERHGSARAEEVSAMTDVVRHRGPDGSGYFADELCALGHRRLKIIDLSERAKQPMSDADGRVIVSFNGEIYNFRELRRQLEKTHPFTSASDTEVIVHGYKEWGLDVFARLNGMFAIALWDRQRGLFVLARDRLGKKPLFYRWHEGRCTFGSELKSILASSGGALAVDEQSLLQYLAFGYVPSPRSIFRGVQKVPQGTYVTFHQGVRSEVPFWRLSNATLEISEDEALEELDRRLVGAVQRRLESDVPLGLMLSGGVDSTLVAAVASGLRPGIQTFSVGFRSKGFDEAPYARRIAQLLRTRHEELYLDDDVFASHIAGAPRYFDEPFADSSCLAMFGLSELMRRHVTVALSGDGGDELFGGYPKYQELERATRFLGLPAPARTPLVAMASRVGNVKLKKMADAVQTGDVRDVVRWLVSIWKPGELRRLAPGLDVEWAETSLCLELDHFDERTPVEQLMAADVRTYLCDDILQKVDRASMSVGLEVRSPLLDDHIVEFCAALPLALKRRRGTSKYLLKRLLERYVPRTLWERPKHGLVVPLKEWYREGRRPVVESLADRLTRGYPWFSRDEIQRVLGAHLRGTADYSQKIFALDMLSLWSSMYGAD